jgi:hypothetical protein
MKTALLETCRWPLEQHLNQLGWSRLQLAGPVYQLGHGSDAARLDLLATLGAGTRWRLDAPANELPSWGEHLAAQASLPGPLKYIDDGSGGLILAADLPAQVQSAAADEYDLAEGAGNSPLAAWVQCLTAIASGAALPAATAPSPAGIIKILEAASYTASLDGESVKTTLVLPGRFAEVSIEADQPCGLKLSIQLTSASAEQAPQIAAAGRQLAEEVNRRLLLARISETLSGETSGGLIAEVRLTLPQVQAAWVLAAMSSLETCALVAVRPLAALQDQALAALVMGLN